MDSKGEGVGRYDQEACIVDANWFDLVRCTGDIPVRGMLFENKKKTCMWFSLLIVFLLVKIV